MTIADNLIAYYRDGVLTLQRAEYIEDGWFMEYKDSQWFLYEIPEGGGTPQFIFARSDFIKVYAKIDTLT